MAMFLHRSLEDAREVNVLLLEEAHRRTILSLREAEHLHLRRGLVIVLLF